MSKHERRLTKSGWFARWDGTSTSTIYLDYEGVRFIRSQSVIRYGAGKYGYDWPELVPKSVRKKVADLFEEGR